MNNTTVERIGRQFYGIKVNGREFFVRKEDGLWGLFQDNLVLEWSVTRHEAIEAAESITERGRYLELVAR